MARGIGRALFTVAATAAGTLALVEARTPGAAAPAVEAGVNGVAPALQGFGVLGGETLRATGPVVAGGRDALADAGLEINGTGAPEDTLPVTPLGGG